MHIKRFEAPTMEAALAAVKHELGPNALILSSRTVQRGRHAFGLLSSSVVEVQAAVERASTATRVVEPSQDPEHAERLRHASGSAAGNAKFAAHRREVADDAGRARFEEEMRSELRGLRQALNSLVVAESRLPLDSVVVALTRMGLDVMHGTSLAEEWRAQSAEGGTARIEDVLRRRIESRLAPPREDEGDRVRVLVGAPGVGKTTTLAKLAGRNEMGERDVALISLDHYRIGGADQLRRYAKMLDSPFVALTEAEGISEVVGRFRGHSVMIDTAGKGRGHEDRLSPLLPLRARLGRQASLELVLDATARPEVQRAHLERFAALKPDRVIFAKSDECDSLVSMANVMLDPGCPPVCWMGTGQRVPEDLELVEANDVVRDVLGVAA